MFIFFIYIKKKNEFYWLGSVSVGNCSNVSNKMFVTNSANVRPDQLRMEEIIRSFFGTSGGKSRTPLFLRIRKRRTDDNHHPAEPIRRNPRARPAQLIVYPFREVKHINVPLSTNNY